MSSFRSRSAFLLSVDKLFRESTDVYFWTFTWRDVHDDTAYAYMWNLFLTGLNDNGIVFPPSLLIVEVHPGGHGLHYHVLVGGFLDIHSIRPIAERCGMFWIDFRECYDTGIGNYLAKYLSKDGPKLSKGMRRWRALGGFRSERVSKLTIESTYLRDRKNAIESCAAPGRRLPWRHENVSFRCWCRCESYADYAQCMFFLLRGDVQSAERHAMLTTLKHD